MDQGTEGETSRSTREIDVLIGDEQQNGKEKKEEKERNKESVPNPATLNQLVLLTTRMDHTVGLF